MINPKLNNEGAPKSNDKRLERRNYGTGHGYKIDGVKADGITTILNGSIPKGALVGWAAGAVAEMVYDDPEWVLDAAKRFGRDGFVKAMKEVPSNDRDSAARRGTEVHKLAELAGRGEEVEVPDELAGHFDAYLDYREHHEPADEMFEVVVANLKYKFMGTLDAWAHLPNLKGLMVQYPEQGAKPLCECEHRCLTLTDIKTSRSGPFGDTGLQLTGYSYAEVYIDAAGEIRDMPHFDHHVVIWLRSDGWELIPFDIQPADFRTFLYCQQVARFTDWKKGRTATIKGEALALPKRKS